MGASHAAVRACLLLVTSVVASLLVAAPAQAAPVALAGTVTGPTGTGLRGVVVTVYRSGQPVDDVTTDSVGAWSAQVEPGTYTLGYDDPQGWYRPEFWDDRSTLATATALTVGTTGRTGVAAQLAPRAVVSGTVRSGDGTPVAGAEVRTYSSTTESDDVRTDVTAADGTYRVPLAPGTYRFAFESPDHRIEYWNDRTTLATSDPVTVSTTDVGGRDVTLTSLPVAGGRVTAGGSAVRRPQVTVYGRDPAGDYWVEQQTVTGDAEGRWSVRLDPGRYTFRFAGDDGHRPEFWADRPGLSTAASVDLVMTPRTFDADLAVLPTLDGRVVDASGEGVEDADVALLDGAGDELRSVRSGPDGGFAVPAVPGAYGLRVSADGFRAWTRSATDDPVLLGTDGAGVGTVPLVAATAIRGRVTGPGGTPVRTTVVVHAASGSGTTTWWSQWSRVRTAADGTWAAPVPPGDYRVEVEGTEELEGEFWQDATTVETARTVTVGESDVTGRDVTLAARTTTGVQGRVTTAGDAPLPGALVDVHALRDGAWTVVEQATTGADGRYRVSLPSGTYRLGFGADVHRSTFGPGATTVATAADVVVGSALVTRDVRLVPVSARIQGTVRGPSSVLPGIDVTVLRGTGDDLVPVTTARTDALGRYEVRVDAGSYVVAFDDPSGDHRGEYLDDATTWASATRVTVADGATVNGRDVRLDAHPRLAGRVTTSGGGPVGDATVRLSRSFADGGDVVSETRTESDGRYDVAAPAGTYTLEVLLDDEPRWTATGVYLGSGSTTRDVALTDLRSIAGRLVGPDARAAVGVEVRAWRYDPADDTGVVVARTVTSSDGRYTLPVAPGVYRVGFHGVEAGYATEWSGDARDLASAPVVRVAGSDVTGIDGALGGATGITGSVSDVAALPSDAWPELEAVFYRRDVARDRWVEQERTTPGYGRYTVELPAGRYRVRVVERQEPFRTAHHGGGSAFSSAADVEVRSGAVTPGVDVVVGATLGSVRVATEPSVTGEVVVGATVQAEPGTWDPGDVSPSYQWMRDGQPVVGATTRSYQPGAADAGRALAVRVTASRPGYQAAVATSPARTVAPGTLAATSPPEITTAPVPGTTVVALAPRWSVGTASATAWQWLRDGTPIDGATASTYTPVAADVGRGLAVRVTGGAPGYTQAVSTSAARTVTDPPLAPTSEPAVSGTAVLGATLQAVDAGWNRTPATTTRQWLRDGQPVDGQVGPSYRLGVADVGHEVAVRVTASLASGEPVERTSSAVEVAAGTLTATTAPSVTGTARLGATLTGRPGTWTATDPTAGPVALTYQWSRGSTAIAGATTPTYKPVTADLGRALTLTVTAAAPGHGEVRRTATSAVVKVGPTLSVTTTAGRRQATFTVVVKATGATPTGTVRVLLGTKVVKTATLSSYRGTRRAVLTAKSLPKGARTYTIQYRGDAKVAPVSTTRRVTVR